jgi:hypothetical protein
MAKSKGKQNRAAKPKTSSDRSSQRSEQRENVFSDPTDDFVTDAEIEAREMDRRSSKSAGFGRKKGR